MKLCSTVANGIHFNCKRCNNCCSANQEGYVLLYQQDIKKLQKALGIPIEQLTEQYIKIIEYDYTVWDKNLKDTEDSISLDTMVLNSGKEEDCVFLKQQDNSKMCSIYPYRPLQCKLYPFWNVLFTSNFEFRMHQMTCPGLANPDKSHYFSLYQIIELIYLERKVEFDYIHTMQKANNNIFKVYPFLKPKVKSTLMPRVRSPIHRE